MLALIIGNLFSLLAIITEGAGASRKTARGVVAVQTLGQALFAVSAFALKGYSAAVQNVATVVRNLVALGPKRREWLEWLLVALGAAAGVLCNNRGFMGLLPVAANLEYALALFRYRDNAYVLKIFFLVKCVLFVGFNAYIYNFVGLAANVTIIFTTAGFLIRERGKNGAEPPQA